jgi:hypothetical protein
MNVENRPRDGYIQQELKESKCVESILDALMRLNEEALKKWIREAYPFGIGLYDGVEE